MFSAYQSVDAYPMLLLTGTRENYPEPAKFPLTAGTRRILQQVTDPAAFYGHHTTDSHSQQIHQSAKDTGPLLVQYIYTLTLMQVSSDTDAGIFTHRCIHSQSQMHTATSAHARILTRYQTNTYAC